MCGVAGIYHYRDRLRQVDVPTLTRMTRSLAHRGPDDEGIHVDESVGLGNRRLAIVDLRPTGHQPMLAADGLHAITYNGEFYNHTDFRRQLEAKGHRFRGSSDTETLLHALAEWGPGVLTDVAGIFAFAWWDRRNRRLLVARDPLGVKQVYYHDDGRRIVFASEIKALLQCRDVPVDVDPEAINEYLHFHTPLFDRTFFKEIRQVLPGEYIEVTRNGLRRRIYWQTDGFEPRVESLQASVAELRARLEYVVGQQLMADVPVAAFFSGGIDSTAVAAFAKKNGRPPTCFGLHFSDAGVIDERPYQESAARALGLKLETTTVRPDTFPEDFLRLTYYQDEPVIGAAMIPMYHVSKLAARSVKVCLGGQAADEIFGGYARYALVHPTRVVSSWLGLGRRSGSEDGDGLNPKVRGNLLKQLGDRRNLRRIARRMLPYKAWERRYFENFVNVPERQWRAIFTAEGFVSRAKAWRVFRDTIARSPAREPGDKILHWDIQTYLPGLFHQDDRMSMANSLESRVPLADPRLVRFALHTSFDLKIREGATKWILRQAVADVIPREVLNRRKVGFDTPAESWMKGPHRQFVRDLLLSTAARTRGYWNTEAVRRALDDENSPYWFDVIWKVASIEAWAATFLDGHVPAGVAAEVREPARP
jgi:asparagine synthase (glutamine-hydrolysing)